MRRNPRRDNDFTGMAGPDGHLAPVQGVAWVAPRAARPECPLAAGTGETQVVPIPRVLRAHPESRRLSPWIPYRPRCSHSPDASS